MMPMTTASVDTQNAARFIAYCTRYGPEHDTSFLPDARFKPSRDRPSYLLQRAGVEVGAVSLLLTPAYRTAGRARFAIFHAIGGDLDSYELLFHAIQPHCEGLRSVYLFLPEGRSAAAAALAHLGFQVERYSFVLELPNPAPARVELPPGFKIVPVSANDPVRQGQYIALINRSFAGLTGHLDLTEDVMQTWYEEQIYLEDGIQMLLEGDRPIGTVSVSRDYENRSAGEIGGLSVAPDRRGQGLGRLLLRHGVAFARGQGLSPIFLSVNGENRSALDLYLGEGFHLVETVVCYTYDCDGR